MRRLSSILSWGVLVLGVVWGCSKKDDGGPVEPGEPVQQAVSLEQPGGTGAGGAVANARAGAFDAALKLWRVGDKHDAAERFLTLDWESPTIFAEGSLFGMPEAEFVKLPEPRRSAVQQEAMDATRAVREMARYVVEEGKTLAAQGQSAAAKTRYDAVARCGNVLADDNQLKIVQMVGEALQKYAAAQAGG